MKKKLVVTHLILLLFTSSAIFAQSKNERRIYLWDVTLSMKGYGGAPNIFQDIVNFLEQEINSLTDETTEIVVCPFQEKILETWEEYATVSGKNSIISKIKEHNNDQITNTNIVGPIQHAQSRIIKNDKHNLLFLLTDGKHNTETKTSLPEIICKWDEYANIHDAYLVYVMLTDAAKDPEIIEPISKAKKIAVTGKPGKTPFVDLQPAKQIVYNIKDDMGKPAQLSFFCKKSIAIPNSIKIKINAEDNPYISVDQTAILKDGKIEFEVKMKLPYDKAKLELAESTPINLHLELEKGVVGGSIVLLTAEDVVLELLNKPEKTLKISIKPIKP